MSNLATSKVGYWLFYTQRCVEYAFSEVLRRHCEARGKPYIVTPAQWGLLTLLEEEGELPIGTLSHKRGLDAPTVTGIVKRLEQSGLVERLHDRADRRVVKVYLTAEGRDIIQSLLTIMDDWNESLLHNFSQAERDNLLEQLQQIVANISDAESGIGDRFGLLPDHIVHH